jgi:EamA domain-containing membrane protein RarD
VWRISQEITPRDQLRGVVRTFGLLQYVLAPLLLAVSALAAKKSKPRWAKVAGFIVMLAAVIAIWLMLHREYYQSLGA